MISQETEAKPESRVMTTNPGFMQVDSIEAAMRCAEIIAKSSFCPKGMAGRAGDVVIALQMGQELGLKPMQAIQNIAVINGRPSLWGDAMLAVCRQSPDFEYIKEEYLEDTKTYICRVKRKHEPEFMQRFSEVDAKTAKLWGKDGPWTQYPRRMLQMRARGFALRDAFPDLLRGIITCEEATDMPKDRIDYSHRIGDVIDGKIVDETITGEQLEIVKKLIEETDTKEIDICGHLKVDCLESMTDKQWVGVCKLLERKMAKKQKLEELEINQVFEEEASKASKEFLEELGEE
jgi:hypothetical protein